MKKSQSWNIFRYFLFLIKLPHLRLVQLAAAAFTALNRHLCRRVLLKPLFQSGHHAGRSDLKGVKIKIGCSGSFALQLYCHRQFQVLFMRNAPRLRACPPPPPSPSSTLSNFEKVRSRSTTILPADQKQLTSKLVTRGDLVVSRVTVAT